MTRKIKVILDVEGGTDIFYKYTSRKKDEIIPKKETEVVVWVRKDTVEELKTSFMVEADI